MNSFLNPRASVDPKTWEVLNDHYVRLQLRIISPAGVAAKPQFIPLSQTLSGLSADPLRSPYFEKVNLWPRTDEDVVGRSRAGMERATWLYAEMRAFVLERYLTPAVFRADEGPRLLWKLLTMACVHTAMCDAAGDYQDFPLVFEIDFTRKCRDRLAIATLPQVGGAW